MSSKEIPNAKDAHFADAKQEPRSRFEQIAAWLLPFHPAAGLVALIGLSFRGRHVWHQLRQQRADLIVWGLLGASGIISVLGAYDTGRAITDWFVPFLFIWLYALGRWAIKSPTGFLRAMLHGTAVFALVIVLARLFRWNVSIGGFTVLGAFSRAGSRGNVLGVPSNGLAMVLEAGVIGGLGLLLIARTARQRVVAAAIAIVCLVATGITLSRGAMVGIAVGTVALGILLTPRALLVLTVAGAGMLGYSERIRNRALSILDISHHQARLDIWKGTLRMIKAHPWFGVGPGNFGLVYPTYSEPGVARFRSAHNNYLFFTAAWGIVGGIIFFGWQAWVMIRSLLRGLSSYQKIMWAILITFGTHVLFDDLMTAYAALLLGCLENPAYERKVA